MRAARSPVSGKRHPDVFLVEAAIVDQIEQTEDGNRNGDSNKSVHDEPFP